jgi:hypothetical protein
VAATLILALLVVCSAGIVVRGNQSCAMALRQPGWRTVRSPNDSPFQRYRSIFFGARAWRAEPINAYHQPVLEHDPATRMARRWDHAEAEHEGTR